MYICKNVFPHKSVKISYILFILAFVNIDISAKICLEQQNASIFDTQEHSNYNQFRMLNL
jgi:hypothetical protein